MRFEIERALPPMGRRSTDATDAGIDPFRRDRHCVNASRRAGRAIDTRCQERTDQSELQPAADDTVRVGTPQSFREITGNTIATGDRLAMRLINDPETTRITARVTERAVTTSYNITSCTLDVYLSIVRLLIC